MKAPIHSDKHYVQMSLNTTGPVGVVNNTLVLAVEGSAASTVSTVVEGALVKAVYIELWLVGEGNAGSNMVILSKEPISAVGPTFTQSQALGTYQNKKNVLFTHQGLSANDAVGNPILIMANWYKIPKGKQRFGLGDRLVLTTVNMHATDDLFACGFATYKEYT